VTEVKDGGSAALANLHFNDLIQAVNDVPTRDVASLAARMKALAEEKPKFVVLHVLRGVHTRYLELEANWNQTP